MRAVNSLKCLITSASENVWYFVAATYWFIAAAGYGEDVNPYLDIAYQNVCTCQEDARTISRLMGISEEPLEMLTGCSEYVSNSKIDVENAKEDYINRVKDANVKAVAEAAAAERVKEVTLELGEIFQTQGEVGLEKK